MRAVSPGLVKRKPCACQNACIAVAVLVAACALAFACAFGMGQGASAAYAAEGSSSAAVSSSASATSPSATSASSATASSAAASAASSSAAAPPSASASSTTSSTASSAAASSASASSVASSAILPKNPSSYTSSPDPFADAVQTDLQDGMYQIDVVLEGGSGKATVESPAEAEVFGGRAVVVLVWSSSHYDYMVVGGKKYLPVNESGNSTFIVPVTAFDEPVPVIGDTTAMSEAHEVNYTLTVKRASAQIMSSEDEEEIEDVDGETVEDVQAEGLPWPWIVFIVCAALSVVFILVTVILLHRYRKRQF